MTRSSRLTPTDVAIPALAALTSFATLVSWAGLSEVPGAFLVPLFWIAAGVAVLGLLLRAVRIPGVLVPALQLVVVGLVLHRSWAVGGALGGWLPTSASLTSVGDLFARALDTTSQYAAPVPVEATEFNPLMVAVGTVVVLSVDALASSLRRPTLAGLPLLAVFTVPVSLLDGVSWLVFSVAAGAFMLLIAAEHAARLGAWGRSLSGTTSAQFDAPGSEAGVVDDQPHEVRLATLWPTASRIGVAGIGVALVVPLLLPSGGGLFDGGDGVGAGIGDDDLRLDNPFVDLRRDLARGADVDLVEATTDDPDPSYLRLTVLDEYDGTTWRPSERDIPEANRVDGELPQPPGLAAATRRTEHDWSMRVSDAFDSQWLPTPYPVTRVQTRGDWRYDVDTLDMVGVDEDASGLRYELSGLELELDPQTLVDAPPAPQGLSFRNTRVPSEVSEWLTELAESVTADAGTQFERAVVLQEWFREDGGFTYSLSPDPGNGADDLADFLGEDGREGYCEQFAASMALMARTLNIPARVAVGFLRPDVGDRAGTVVYSAHDLHAWPELYFEGAGWVRFEPTPQDRATDAPSYTVGELPQTADDAAPTPGVTQEAPERTAEEERAAREATDGTGQGALPGWAPWLLGAALVVGLGFAPRLARSWQRRRRYAEPDPDRLAEQTWAEVRAIAVDLGLPWDDGATLRTRATGLLPCLGGSPEGISALERLVLLLERARYSRAGLPARDPAEVTALGISIATALRAAAAPKAIRRATWLPASLWRGTRGARTRRDVVGSPRTDRTERVSV